ncbi:MAG TPA: DUF1707 domain-containing protein [Solirubrobacteraceae bacterium]|nr:DUF1707 domain-containing protein [Solirubrobacteraceae bacterium]
MAEDDLRASDSERDELVDALRNHAAEGRLTTEELEERTGAAYAATTRGELVALRRDLPEAAPPSQQGAPPTVVGERIAAVLSSSEQGGHWLVPERLHVKAVLGDCKLDLRQAEVPAEVTIDVKVRLGDVTIYVPENARVELTGRALLGDKKVRGIAGAAGGGPLIRVHADVILGDLKVDVATGWERVRGALGRW